MAIANGDQSHDRADRDAQSPRMHHRQMLEKSKAITSTMTEDH
jgi:hypothetical protein